MLDTETKRKIDAARQILVGIVPDPKAQVEQITTALVYKFMDDMDKQSQELGGIASFFTNGLEPYSWTKLMDARLGGQARLELYAEAIRKIPNTPHLPQIFRDIFKGAFLPYRNPETGSLFLKEIDGFTYEHSENLGSAFEYLLSVLGSQGDAGQFRTPRHIIDFMVQIMAPKKTETILDPACGTAGFLISAYKYIVKQHSSPNQTIPRGDLLSPAEKKNLVSHFSGYDISPDMVKLSLVNLYLHGFPSPIIHEYDTLTSDTRWDEQFNIILANPPFMSPTGGIRPHNRFSVQANRAEVLFVEYIAEHLSMHGRAAIIVPEGIIFTAANAYKQLRGNLLNDWGLYAVVSLPTGVFNPYSGVKTSILLLDKTIATTRDEILFIKVEHDGYHLGARRRPVDNNDLPVALEILLGWKTGKKKKNECALWIKKERIAENGEYGLTGDRYRETVDYRNVKWEMVELGGYCEVLRGTSVTKKDMIAGDIPVIAGGQQPAYYHNQSNRKGKTITVSGSGAYAGFVNFFQIPIFASDCSTIKTSDATKLSTDFVFYILKHKQSEVYKLQSGMGQPHVYAKDIKKLKIPLPPIEIQEHIVAEIEVEKKAIEQCKKLMAQMEKKIEAKIRKVWGE